MTWAAPACLRYTRLNSTSYNLLISFIPLSKTMKRVLFFIITCSLVAADPRDKQAQVSVCPSFSRAYRLLKHLFHYSKLLDLKR